jgi:MFS family permease
MSNVTSTLEQKVKWPEIFSLGFLNAAVVISWIAYHEYQPVLIAKFEFESLVNFMVISKGIILVIIPPIAGLLADRMIAKKGNYFTIFTVGIGATAMVFMVVASMIGIGPISSIKTVLPGMIVLWLIAMNLFMSPANSMIDTFAPAQKLPIVVGFLFLVTELIYALEPVVVALVQFFGDTLTFVVGGILIAGSGYLFHRVSSNEVVMRKKELVETTEKKTNPMAFVAILIIGLQLGVGKAFVVEFFPTVMVQRFTGMEESSGLIALGLLALAAFFAFGASFKIAALDLNKVLPIGFIGVLIGAGMILLGNQLWIYLIGGLIASLSFALVNVAGMPFAFKYLTAKHITYGIGIFIGASELFTGIFEIMLD